MNNNRIKITKPMDQCPKCKGYLTVGHSGSKYCLEPECIEFIIVIKQSNVPQSVQTKGH